MIQCDQCEEWFHGRCVGVTVEEAQRLDGYVCPPCSSVSISICRRDSDSDEEPRRSWRSERPETPREKYHLIPSGMEGSAGQKSKSRKRPRSEARGSSPGCAPQGAEGGSDPKGPSTQVGKGKKPKSRCPVRGVSVQGG
jgi:hypothetical protein